jgi:hypothetical protein
MFTQRGRGQKGSVLAAATESETPIFRRLPVSVAGAGRALGAVAPASSTDWFRLLLFLVLGSSLMLGIRYTLRDLAQ